MFVGQRKDSFAVNLGETFDLINIKAPAVEFDPNAEKAAKDDLADKNITSLELEVPTACLLSATAGDPVIGGWTTASLRQGRLLNPRPGANVGASIEGGAWVQVSRLGMPLVNEVVIGLKDKDTLQPQQAIGRWPVRRLRHQSDPAGADRSAVRLAPAPRRRPTSRATTWSPPSSPASPA